MNPFLEKSSGRTLRNKGLHLLEFIYASDFKSSRVMKNKVWVASEDHLILDVVHSTLRMHEPLATQTAKSTMPLALTPADS